MTQPRVMLLDDEQDIVQVMKSGLQLKGFKVDGFTNPKQATESFSRDKYDVVISDIRMPEMDGFEVYRSIREKDPNVSFYFMSAFDSYENQMREMFPNAHVSFIRKPISYKQLAEVLSKHHSVQ